MYFDKKYHFQNYSRYFFAMGLIKKIFISVLCLFVGTSVWGQVNLETGSATELASKIEASPLNYAYQISQSLETESGNPKLWLLLSKVYTESSLQTNPFLESDKTSIYLDSSILCLDKAQQYTSKKSLKKFNDFYITTLDYPTISFDNYAEVFGQRKSNLSIIVSSHKEAIKNFKEATAYYALAQKRYQAASQKHASQSEIKLLNESSFIEQFIPVAYNFLQSKSLLEKAFNEAGSHFKQLPSIENTSAPLSSFIEGKNIQVYNFQQWYEQLSESRKVEIRPLQIETTNTLSQLIALENKTKLDSLGATFHIEIPPIEEVLKNWNVLSGENILTEYLSYKYQKIELMRRTTEEKSHFNYKYGQEEVFQYYYNFQKDIRLLNDKINSISKHLKEGDWDYYSSVLNQYYEDEQDFQAVLNKEKAYLNKRYTYCDLKIHNQLVYENIELKYLPRYSKYKGGMVPLFEQSLNMVVEEGDYVTTRVLKDEVGNLYITGYKKQNGRKGFVARVVGQRIAWIHWATKPETLKEQKVSSYGTMLSLGQSGGCLAVMQYKVLGDTTTKLVQPHLLAIDSTGSLNKSFALETQLDIEQILPSSEDKESYLTASLGYVPNTAIETKKTQSKESFSSYNGIPIVNSSQPQTEKVSQQQEETINTEEALVIEKLDFDGASEWKTNIPFKGRFTGMVELEDRFILVCNQLLDETNQHKVHLIALNKSGEIIAQKTIETTNPCFATKSMKLENDQVLVVGFKGEYEINAIENKEVMNMLIDENLELLESSVE